MALSAVLTNAGALLTAQGLTLTYTVLVTDDTLGDLGTKSYEVTDPATIASVTAYIEQMLPTIEAQVGLPVTLPFDPNPPSPPDPDPVP